MSDLDYTLLYQARKLLNGANTHTLRTAIFCYETSAPGSSARQTYEQGLRDLVRQHAEVAAAMDYARAVCRYAKDVRAKCDALNQEIAVALPYRNKNLDDDL
jgi:hypothetical protein